GTRVDFRYRLTLLYRCVVVGKDCRDRSGHVSSDLHRDDRIDRSSRRDRSHDRPLRNLGGNDFWRGRTPAKKKPDACDNDDHADREHPRAIFHAGQFHGWCSIIISIIHRFPVTNEKGQETLVPLLAVTPPRKFRAGLPPWPN